MHARAPGYGLIDSPGYRRFRQRNRCEHGWHLRVVRRQSFAVAHPSRPMSGASAVLDRIAGMLIHTMIEATHKAAQEYFSWRTSGRLSPTTREAQSRRARHELLRLGHELVTVLPDPSGLVRFLNAVAEGGELAVELDLWRDAQVETSRVHEQPRLASRPKVPVVWWSRKWGWQREWAPGSRR